LDGRKGPVASSAGMRLSFSGEQQKSRSNAHAANSVSIYKRMIICEWKQAFCLTAEGQPGTICGIVG
jgi:hypothetical protein